MARRHVADSVDPGAPPPGFAVMKAPLDTVGITIPIGTDGDTKHFPVKDGCVECSEDFIGVLQVNGFTVVSHTPAAPPAPAEGERVDDAQEDPGEAPEGGQ